MSSGDVKLSAPVGPGAANDPGDVLRVESVLSDADLLDRPPGRSFGDDTFSAIKAAQARLNDDPRVDIGRGPLKLDGLVNPDGPTQAATRKLAGDVIARRAATAPKPQPPKPATAPSGAAKTIQGGPRRETLAQTVKRFAKGKPLTPHKPAPESAMTGDQVAALKRLAGGLRKVTHPGPVAKDIADAFRADGPGTVAEFKAVRDVLEKTGTAEQVENFTEGVRAELNPKDRGRFDRLLAGTDGGDRDGSKMTPPRKPIPPGSDTPGGGFESSIDRKFREQLHLRETQGRPQQGYDTHVPGDGVGAIGRYQLRQGALQDAGLIDGQGRWTGKYGIRSIGDLRKNPEAQKRALVGALQAKHKQLRTNRSFDAVGHTFTGVLGQPITITEPGLLAAAHRQGAKGVRKYLGHMRKHNWRSNFSGIDPKEAIKFKAIEKRLREFQNTPVRRK
ncbi:MAG: hypothetical protein IH994_02945 [Proteobacteria bacterium]|nr:hypothetical protein [Pseudomonadota bacterium]